jgi:hypothetical protein
VLLTLSFWLEVSLVEVNEKAELLVKAVAILLYKGLFTADKRSVHMKITEMETKNRFNGGFFILEFLLLDILLA